MTKQTEAMKLALEALEDMRLVELSMEDLLSWNKAVKAIKQALAAPVQEPVAVADGTFNHNCPVGTPLYTSPPAQRTWVGLTDEEIEKCFAESDGTFISAGRAIEAAHGIKENK